MSYVEFKNVCKTYQVGEVATKALDNVSFEIEEGELVTIVGQLIHFRLRKIKMIESLKSVE